MSRLGEVNSKLGFIKADSSNLPKLDVLAVYDFITSDIRLTLSESRQCKTSQSTSEKYGENAIGYVEVAREGNVCTVNGRVTPEHKVTSSPYHVTVKINEISGNINFAECLDCAASLGCCKHAIAFLFWIHRRSEQKSPTEVECYWKKSTLSRVGTTIKCVKATDFAEQSRRRESSNIDTSGFLKEVIRLGSANGSKGELFKHFTTQNHLQLDMYSLLNTYEDLCKCCVDDFLLFCKSQMTQGGCDDVLKNTMQQCQSPLWHKFRFARITASVFHESSRCKTDGSLVQVVTEII